MLPTAIPNVMSFLFPVFVDPLVPTFVCGDFNAVFNRATDRRGFVPPGSGRDSSDALLSFFQDCCMVDIWRSLHPDASGFTWDKPDGSISSRIDFIGCPYAWAPFTNSCSIVPCPFSDHSLVCLNITVPEVCPRGPGKWKLNISVLKDDGFVSEVKTFWSKWQLRKSCFSSLQSWWDSGKSKIKGIAINHCDKLASERAQKRSLLVNVASHLKSRVDSGVVSCFDVLESVQSQIAEIDLTVAKGAQIRSRVKWAEDGEQSTSYFLCLEKKNSSDCWIAAFVALMVLLFLTFHQFVPLGARFILICSLFAPLTLIPSVICWVILLSRSLLMKSLPVRGFCHLLKFLLP